MAEAVVEAILGHLECAICHCRLEDAKCLKCLHTFCESCINRAIEANADSDSSDDYDELDRPNHRFRCPMCRQETGYDYDRSEALRPNLLANKIIEEIKRHEDSESKKELCKEHGAEKKFFCEKCNVLICSECALCNHGKHTFLIKNLEEASKAKVEEIVKLMTKATEWMESYEHFREDYAAKQAEGNERLDNISDVIKVRFNSYLEHVTDIINHRKEDLLAEVKTNRSDLNEALDNILIPVGEAVSKVTEEIELAEELLDSTDPKEVVLQYKDWAKRLSQGTDQQIPSDAAARRQCTRVGSLHFSESEAPVFEVPKLGVLRLQVPEANSQGEEKGVLQLVCKRRLLLTLRTQVSGKIKIMTPYKNDSILVHYQNGHTEVLCLDGSCSRIRSTNISAKDMAALSDGRFVTLTRNKVKIYESGGIQQQIKFSIHEDDGMADAITTDAEDNVLLLYSELAKIVRLSSGDGSRIDAVSVVGIKSNGVLRINSTKNGKIAIIQDDGVVIASPDDSCRVMALSATGKVSCDQEGNLWVISHHTIQGTSRAFLEVYGDQGELLAETYLPNDNTAVGFEPWGIAVSTSCFAAVLSPSQVGWFIWDI
ncbi:tripartite motif-containing protein 54-like [Lytechinus variegatus]|uniref:tripartite motif-containing protein 54-like n=1 Tax=Lytechinus variegatus TaxID=7654 RepID=UPI001BB15FF9|nr:tripartite motif-containing protein 54-like [Lytechinus variegatus]